jgi:ligand-binding sensor domain-containing protein
LDVDPATGKLLICTQTGLSVFDGKDSWKTFQGDYEILQSDGGAKVRIKKKGTHDVPSPNVTAAVFVGNTVWIGTPAGLVRIDGEKTELFDTDRGLPSSAVTALAYCPSINTLFVGTEKGLAAISPVLSASSASGETPKRSAADDSPHR